MNKPIQQQREDELQSPPGAAFDMMHINSTTTNNNGADTTHDDLSVHTDVGAPAISTTTLQQQNEDYDDYDDEGMEVTEDDIEGSDFVVVHSTNLSSTGGGGEQWSVLSSLFRPSGADSSSLDGDNYHTGGGLKRSTK